MRLRDVVLFNITAIVGLRWLTTAASQFGIASLLMWVLAMMLFFIPSAIAVRELADIDPGAGGMYRWVSRAFGPMHGFIAGWGYWVNNLFYFPSLLLSTAAIAAYAGGARFAALGDNTTFILVLSIIGLWIAIWMNLVGLRVGKWLQNVGGYGTWIPAGIFVVLAVWSFAVYGSATPWHAADLVPHRLDLSSINLFATLTFAFAGLELAPTLGGEITDPAATLRRGVLVSGVAIVAIYILCTGAVLVALPHETVSVTNGMPQAIAALTARLGVPVLAPLAAVIAIMLVISNIGGVGAWAAGSARLPFAAGLDKALPAAFARVHPTWQTPYVALLFQGVLATILVVVSLAGETAKSAYLALVQTTLILFFIPYLYIFGAYLRLRRVRTWGTAMTGWLGFAAVLFSIVLGFVPPSDEPHPGWYRIKVVGGVVLFMGIGWWLARRGVRERTASRAAAG